MEIKLSVSIGATLQVKNAKGEWDWIKPEVGAEVKLIEGEIQPEETQKIFSEMWDQVVGPQFANVVKELISDPVATKEEVKETEEEVVEEVKVETISNHEEDEYY
jgi:hypothetical protein